MEKREGRFGELRLVWQYQVCRNLGRKQNRGVILFRRSYPFTPGRKFEKSAAAVQRNDIKDGLVNDVCII